MVANGGRESWECTPRGGFERKRQKLGKGVHGGLKEREHLSAHRTHRSEKGGRKRTLMKEKVETCQP